MRRPFEAALPCRGPLPGKGRSLSRLALAGVVAATGIVLGPLGAPAAAQPGFGEIVRAFCLSAFESEMEQAGKVAPAGMADYACGCITGRLRAGTSIESARAACRQETARRYPI